MLPCRVAGSRRPHDVKATFVGLGARRALRTAGPGVVFASFSRATYINTPEGMFALVAPGVPPGPVHLGVDRLYGEVAGGAAVAVDDGRLYIEGRSSIDYRQATTWIGFIPDLNTRCCATLLAALAPLAARSALRDALYRGRVQSATEAFYAHDLPQAASALSGLGPGLTPAGDDALAGALLSARVLWGEAAEPSLRAALAHAETGLISRSFLEWAAAGQVVAPVHELLHAASKRDRTGAERAVTQLGGIGASSGADLAFGLSIGLEMLAPRSASCRTASKPCRSGFNHASAGAGSRRLGIHPYETHRSPKTPSGPLSQIPRPPTPRRASRRRGRGPSSAA